jgi:putative SOS response-associated peptidase YedK
MCGRYLLKTALEELARIFGFTERPNLMPRYNIAPTLEVPVIRQRREPAGQRSIAALRWGLVLPWADDPKAGPPLINARAEKRRCLIPADGYYQWKEGDASKQPYLIARRDRAPFAFAGLWERWGPRHDPAAALDSFTIITADANEFLSGFHHRMPVVLTSQDYATWLDPDSPIEAALDLLTPAANDLLEAVPLDRAVNSNRAEGADLLTPAGATLSWQGNS